MVDTLRTVLVVDDDPGHRGMLEALLARWGFGVTSAADGREAVERVAEDFYLPSPTGQGTPLTRDELAQRLEERAPQVYFSTDLCAHYFTYMSDASGAHFVLFDDAGSIRKKLQLARQLDIGEALLPYAQVDDLLPELLGG